MAIKSQLATLAVANNASPAVFNEVNQIRTLAGPDGVAAEIDVSHLGSLRKEFLQGLADEGNISVEGFYDPTDTDGQGELRNARNDATARNFKITLSSGQTLTFSAFVSSYALSQAVDEAVTFTASLRITGVVTYS